jgi:hypothetical protein
MDQLAGWGDELGKLGEAVGLPIIHIVRKGAVDKGDRG